MKKIIIFLVFIAAIASGAYITKLYLKKTIIGEPIIGDIFTDEDKKERKSTNPLFIESYIGKDFDGRDLSIEKKLNENSAYTRYLISYMSGEEKITGAMNVPKGDGVFPVLFMNHGLVNEKLYSKGKGFEEEQDYFARHDYVTFYSDYRIIGNAGGNLEKLKAATGYNDDVINAVYAVRDSDFSFFDKTRMGMLGHSMGGGLTLNVAVTQPGLLRAYALFAPTSADQRDNYAQWVRERPEIVKAVNIFVGSPENNPEFWDKISASSYLDNIDAPVTIHHGTKDEVVPAKWSRNLNERLKEKDKEVEFFEYLGENHEFDAEWKKVMERTLDFLDRNVKN